MPQEVKTRRELQRLAHRIVATAEASFRVWRLTNEDTVDEDGDSNEVWLHEIDVTAQSFLNALSRYIRD
jgi:hypothetical protein